MFRSTASTDWNRLDREIQKLGRADYRVTSAEPPRLGARSPDLLEIPDLVVFKGSGRRARLGLITAHNLVEVYEVPIILQFHYMQQESIDYSAQGLISSSHSCCITSLTPPLPIR